MACLISSFSTDGFGHQLHARLSCMAAAAFLRNELALPVEYIRQPFHEAQHARPSELPLMVDYFAALEAGERALDGETMRVQRRPSASARPVMVDRQTGARVAEERADHFCSAGNLNSSFLFQLLTRTTEASRLCRPNTVYSGDNCFDILVCATGWPQGASVAAQMARASSVWALVSKELRARYLRVHMPPISLAHANRHGAWAAGVAVVREVESGSALHHSVTSIAVHIRRGDTVLQSHRHMGDAMLVYFNRTVDTLRKRYASLGHPARFTIVTDERKPHWICNQSDPRWRSNVTRVADAACKQAISPITGGHGTSFGTSSQRSAVHRLFEPLEDVVIADSSSLTEDFNTMVHSQVLVISLSSLSYAAALLRAGDAGGTIVAPTCMHQITNFLPMPSWDLALCCPELEREAVPHDMRGRRLGRSRGSRPRPLPSFC